MAVPSGWTLSLLLALSAGPPRPGAGQTVELAPVPCDDRVVGKLARLAVTYVNEDREEGYKFALNRVAKVHLHAQGPAGSVYYLDLDVLETKCHTRSPKPWKRCEVRPFMETQISGNCNITILHTAEGFSYLYSYDCTLVPDSPERLLQTCPSCPLLLPLDSPVAQAAAHLSLQRYKQQSTMGTSLELRKITRAAAKVTPVQASFVEYTVHECPEGASGTCTRVHVNGDQTEPAGFCVGSVYGDMKFDPDIQVSCEMFKLQNVDHSQPIRPQTYDLNPAVSPSTPDLGFDPRDPPMTLDDPPQPIQPTLPAFCSSCSSSSSSSSESSETNAQTKTAAGNGPDSSEELTGVVALRPPFNFRYKPRRRKRQSLLAAPPPHTPLFLSDFPSGPSPFRSCPGPSRYTTV